MTTCPVGKEIQPRGSTSLLVKAPCPRLVHAASAGSKKLREALPGLFAPPISTLIQQDMPTDLEITGQAPGPLDTAVRHLWKPLLDSGLGRVTLGGPPEAGWSRLQALTIQPLRRRPRLLVSDGGGPALARALASYRHLRTPTAHLWRLVLAGKAGLGLNAISKSVNVEARNAARGAEIEPISVMQKLLERPVVAVVGIRDTANGKATLQLFDTSGAPAAYSKLAWNDRTAAFVRTEAAALKDVARNPPNVRIPRVLAEGTIDGTLPFVMTEPLPMGVKRVDGSSVPRDVVGSLFPVKRLCKIHETRQYQGVRQRISMASRQSSDQQLATTTHALAEMLAASDVDIPVAERWHGDLVPWNAARDRLGNLWLWDWESSEEDAAVGLDLLHWTVNSATKTGGKGSISDRWHAAVEDVSGSAPALGLAGDSLPVVAAAYALTFAERNWALAVPNDDWGRHRIGRRETIDLLSHATSLLTHATRK